MTDEFDRLMWAYRAVFTQMGAGGGNVVCLVTAQERTEILYGAIGPDDYAAARAIQAYVADSVLNVLGYLRVSDSIDNLHVPLITGALTGTVTALRSLALNNKLILGRGESIRIFAASLVQNETMTVAIRALLGPNGAPPLTATTGSTGTVTETVTYDVVI
jgi:hypothetical protein